MKPASNKAVKKAAKKAVRKAVERVVKLAAEAKGAVEGEKPRTGQSTRRTGAGNFKPETLNSKEEKISAPNVRTSKNASDGFKGGAKVRPKNPKAKFLPYQTKWILDRARIKAMEKSRQIGISWADSYETVRSIAPADRTLDTWISSRDEAQAALYLQDCVGWAKFLQYGAKDLGEKVYEDENGKAFKSFEMQMKNGWTIHSLSSNPDAQAGKRGPRKLDEFALNPWQRKLYAIAYPGITWGGNLSMISTHRGNMTFFNELIREVKEKGNPKKISLHTVTLQDALDQGFLYKLQQKLSESAPEDERIHMDEAEYFNMVRRECPDEETFLQEFMCVPADDKSAFLEWDLIASAEYAAGEIWETLLEDCIGELYIGVDVGRRHDLTVIWVLEKIAGYWFTRRVVELKNTRFSKQEEILWPLIAHRKTRRCCIDSTGLGMQLAERAQEKFGIYRVEAVTFTPAVKEELAYPLRAVMEERAIKIPLTKEIRTDLRAVKKETTSAGNIRFTADTGPDGHSDRFWALALAVHAGKTPTGIALPPIRTRVWTPDGYGQRAGRSLQG
jgi:phage FluMu gp28-like protein